MSDERYVLIGTAGHVDHGKTWLTKALTGIDTDRLPEEKSRGITIETGFAPLKLPDGTKAAIADVPGHEKFIKNMVAGAGGIDMVMLVVAADEGVMPQTVEHLEILSLLGISQGLVALTKIDAVQEEQRCKAEAEIRDLCRDTFLEQAPILRVSAATGEGIETLKEALSRMVSKAKEKRKDLPFCLPIDRVFTRKGFGTIVTGTLIQGSLGMTDEVMLYPEEELVKIRSIQVHGQEQSKVLAGQRVAVNLPGKQKEEISRGEILAAPGSMQRTVTAEAFLKVMKSAGRTVKSGSRVHLYHGAKELICRVILKEQKELQPGEEGVALLRMEEETALRKGEPFVIRFYSPVETIGGGMILDPCPKKRGRGSEQTLDSKVKTKDKKEGISTEMLERIGCIYENAGFQPPLTEEIKTEFKKEKDFSKAFFFMVREKRLMKLDETHYLHRSFYEKALIAAKDLQQEKGQIMTGEFRDRLGISRKNAIALLEGFDRDGFTERTGNIRTLRSV
ncbi:selenocysteine-specific translation elongation factor [Ruminococcus sp. 5_1_39BFAA]|uniref:selenocysteine-specific translation elongation factor n=1 Tax=Ruminococcus sp. 5_1_39BFAA TaxID=457412 RepID=UPI003563BC80